MLGRNNAASGLVVSACIALAAGCGGSDETSREATTTQTETTEAKVLEVGLVADAGELNDNGFNELAYNGLKRAERELGIHVGATAEDGSVTLRTVECLGGCGWATVVALDNHHRLNVRAGDVPGIAKELSQ